MPLAVVAPISSADRRDARRFAFPQQNVTHDVLAQHEFGPEAGVRTRGQQAEKQRGKRGQRSLDEGLAAGSVLRRRAVDANQQLRRCDGGYADLLVRAELLFQPSAYLGQAGWADACRQRSAAASKGPGAWKLGGELLRIGVQATGRSPSRLAVARPADRGPALRKRPRDGTASRRRASPFRRAGMPPVLA